MTEVNVLSALDAFIGTFEPDRSEPKSHRGQCHERETPIDREKMKNSEKFAKAGSRVESPIHKNNGSFGPYSTNTPAFPPVSPGPVRASRATRETRWHLDHGERAGHQLCAGCRKPIDPADDEILDLADDNRVHLADGYRCLIAWGRRWRAAARAAIAQFEPGPWGAQPRPAPSPQTAARPVLTRPKQRTSQPHPGPCPHPKLEKEIR
jgi:hypothetical protein